MYLTEDDIWLWHAPLESVGQHNRLQVESDWLIVRRLIQGDLPVFNLRPGASIPHFDCQMDYFRYSTDN